MKSFCEELQPNVVVIDVVIAMDGDEVVAEVAIVVVNAIVVKVTSGVRIFVDVKICFAVVDSVLSKSIDLLKMK